jgi:hypothetical protein
VRVVCLLVCLAPSLAWAGPQAIDFNVSPNAVAAGYSALLSPSGFGFDLYGLHHSQRGNVFAAGIALHANADPGGPPVRVSLGVRALDVDSFLVHHSGGAVGFRLGVRYVVPQYNRIGFGGSVVYAPNVTSFDRLARFAAFEGYAGYYLLRHGLLYLAYRHVAAAYDTTPLVTLDSGFNVGFRISF